MWQVVRARGLEPPWGCPHTDLNRTRLPIPPRPQSVAPEEAIYYGNLFPFGPQEEILRDSEIARQQPRRPFPAAVLRVESPCQLPQAQVERRSNNGAGQASSESPGFRLVAHQQQQPPSASSNRGASYDQPHHILSDQPCRSCCGGFSCACFRSLRPTRRRLPLLR